MAVIAIRPADVRPHLGLASTDTAKDTLILQTISTYAELIQEDAFSTDDLRKMSASQRTRATLGISYIIAAKVLEGMYTASAAGDTGSVKVAAISLSSGTAGSSLSAMADRARRLNTQGEEILTTLRIALSGDIPWRAV